MKLSEYFISAFMLLNSVMFSTVIAETLDYQSSNTGIGLIKTEPPIGPPPPTTGFLKNYTNPEQAKVPADGIYPTGQRMWLSAYSTFGRHYRDVRDAGFTLNGPYYHGGLSDVPNWEDADAHGMKGIYHLRMPDSSQGNGWGAVLPRMKTAEGRKFMKDYITKMINKVQADPKLNNHIVAWYGNPEEPMKRSGMTMTDARECMKFAHDVIQSVDKKKRPVYVSERSDSAYWLMIGNQCGMQDGALKQNYLIQSNAYNGGDTHERMVMWRWAMDVVETARDADKKCPSYTGKPRAAITTLSAYIDPKDPSEQNETWLRKAITYDLFVSLAAGVDGITVYAYNPSGSFPHKTQPIQRKLYNELLGFIGNSGLGKVFLWGDDRTDIQMDIAQGPEEIKWKKYSNTYTAPSVFMRNIQYGDARYILLVNNSKEIVKPKLAGFPVDNQKMKIQDMLPDKWYQLNSTLTPTIQPLGVRMYKIVADGDIAPPHTGSGIQPYAGNPMYWEYNGQPTLLLGGMVHGEPHLFTKSELISELDKLKAAGGNYMRDTMAIYTKTHVQDVYPFVKRSDGKFDLNQLNPVFWNYVKTFYEETQKRGMIVQVELWDQWEFFKTMWDQGVWNPKNNINYTQSATGIPEVFNDIPYRVRHPFFLAHQDSNKKVVLKYQEAYIKKLLNVGKPFNNIIYEIGNESSEPQSWNDHWAKFVHAHAGKKVYVTDQRGDYNPKGDLLYVIDHSEMYSFMDLAQIGMGHTSDWHQKHYDDYVNVINRVKASDLKRPCNVTKMYKWIRSWGDKYKGGDDVSVNRLWHGIFSGLAGVAFHPQGSAGSAMTPLALRHIKSMRTFSNMLDITKMEPGNGKLSDRSTDEAYALSERNNGNSQAVYFTGKSDHKVSLDLRNVAGTLKLTWFDPDTGQMQSPKSFNAGGVYTLLAPSNSRWVAIIK